MRRAQDYQRTHTPTEYEQMISRVQGVVQSYLNEAALPLMQDIVVPGAYLQRQLGSDQLTQYGRLMSQLGQDLGDHHWRYTQHVAGERSDPTPVITESIDQVENFMRKTRLDVPARMQALAQLRQLVGAEEIAQVVDARINGQGK